MVWTCAATRATAAVMTSAATERTTRNPQPGAMRRARHSPLWRAQRAFESALAHRPLIRRTGPAWAFGALGLVGELTYAPVVLAATVVIGVLTYLLLDAP